MSKVIKNLKVTWDWEGDKTALAGFNVALTPRGAAPTNDSDLIAVDRSSADEYQHIFRNVVVDTEQEIDVWVQAIVKGKDSDWENTSGVSIKDKDGASLIQENSLPKLTKSSIPKQPIEPGNVEEYQLWLDNSDGIKLKRYESASWVDRTAKLEDIRPEIEVYKSQVKPQEYNQLSIKEFDLWLDTSGEFVVLKQYYKENWTTIDLDNIKVETVMDISYLGNQAKWHEVYDENGSKPDDNADVTSEIIPHYTTDKEPTNDCEGLPKSVDVIKNSNGTATIEVKWDPYSQPDSEDDLPADFLLIFVNKGSEAVDMSNYDESYTVHVDTNSDSAFSLEGVAPNKKFSFGLAAARRTESGILTTKISSPEVWTNIDSGDQSIDHDDVPGKAGQGAVDINSSGITGKNPSGYVTFQLDTEGFVTVDGESKTTHEGTLVSRLFKDNYGGVLELFDNNGSSIAKIGATDNSPYTTQEAGRVILNSTDGSDKIDIGIRFDYNDNEYGNLEIIDLNNNRSVRIYGGYSGNQGGHIDIYNDDYSKSIELIGETGEIKASTLDTNVLNADFIKNEQIITVETGFDIEDTCFFYGNVHFYEKVTTDGIVKMGSLPTSDPNEAGQIWNDDGSLKISSG